MKLAFRACMGGFLTEEAVAWEWEGTPCDPPTGMKKRPLVRGRAALEFRPPLIYSIARSMSPLSLLHSMTTCIIYCVYLQEGLPQNLHTFMVN